MSAAAATARSAKTRTAKATRARRVARAKRLAVDLSIRLPLLDDWWLHQLARNVIEEMKRREVAGGRSTVNVDDACDAEPALAKE